ncbi:MAG: aldehyde ferredoxin oxidoreductase family protein [Anaerolineales bacterium]|nr:aldehyde ferredoxin oxidoreductase family protein [Anaerolineales bacterium]
MDIKTILGGTFGKILHIDLTERSHWVEPVESSVMQMLVGGRALIAFLLLRDLPAGADALSPDNLLIFAPGILQGTSLPGAGRHAIGAKSPLTGGLGSSEAGGWWGDEFKRTGYDALVVHGASDEPVYIWIHEDGVEIRPANHIWGSETAETDEMLRDELGDDRIRIAQIGIGGENLVRFASVMSDVNRAAGRNGLGAVMGSKKLKAVAVRGHTAPKVVDRKRLTGVSRWLGENYKEKVGWAVKMGNPIGVLSLGRAGGLPTKNFREPQFEQMEKISGQLMHEVMLAGRDTCNACPVKCKQVVENTDSELGYTFKAVYGGPEYETIGALGSCCYVNDIYAVAKGNERCNAYGIDTISAGVVIAFIMECVENGLLTGEQTGGYLPEWGDADAMLQGVELIARMEGFGADMARGVKWLSEKIGGGSEAFAMHVKGQELPMHEPRLKAAMGVGYAVAPVGADHMMNIHDVDYAREGSSKLKRVNTLYETGPLPANELSEKKMNVFHYEVNFQHFLDCALVCMIEPYDYQHMVDAVSAVTGVEYSVNDILTVGERAQTLGRIFNYREGFTSEDDRLPRRVMTAFEEGPIAGNEITDEDFDWALHRYYELAGWDKETGEPSLERIEELGIDRLLSNV